MGCPASGKLPGPAELLTSAFDGGDSCLSWAMTTPTSFNAHPLVADDTAEGKIPRCMQSHAYDLAQGHRT